MQRLLLFLSLISLLAPVQAQKRSTSGKSLSGTLKITLPKAEKSVENTPIIITVKNTSEVPGDFFKLGEIAELAGRDENYKQKLSAVEIGRAPLPGNFRNLYPGDIVVHLRAAGLDSDRIELIAPPLMRITRAKSDVAQEKLLQIALSTVQEAFGETPGTTFEPQPLRGSVTVSVGKVRYVAGAYRGSVENGTLTIPISILVDDKPQQVVDVTVKVKRKMRLVVATRTLEPRDTIAADDVMLVQMELPPGFSQPINDLKGAIGKRAGRRILAEMPIAQGWLETPHAVNAREKVRLEQSFGALQVSTVVVARQSGAIGDTIRVYCEDTKKEFEVVIVNSKTVHLPGVE